MERRNAWLSYEEADEKELEKLAKNYRTFLDAGKTERECVLELTREAEAAGYVSLENKLASGEQIKAGDKIYAVGMKKIMAMFHIGQEPIEKGMNILGAHIDSPRLDVKQNPLYEDTDLVYLDTHYYGGVKKYQWVTLPLAIHGVVVKKDGSTAEVNIGEDEDDPIVYITDLLIHLAGKQMQKKATEVIEGENLDILIGSMIYGALPYETRRAETDRFAKGETSVVVATDAIGMGLNLPIKRVVFLETEKFDGYGRRDLLPEEIQQIAGRAGRKGLYECGYYTSSKRKSFIRSSMTRSPSAILFARLGFPRMLIEVEGKLSEVMKRWIHIETESFFLKTDLTEELGLCQWLEGLTDDKEMTYRLMYIPFNTENPELLTLWKESAKMVIDRGYVDIDDPVCQLDEEFGEAVCEGDTNKKIQALEVLHQKYDVFHNFVRLFGMPGRQNWDKNLIRKRKKEISKELTDTIREKKLKRRKCMVCGRNLPFGYPYKLCQPCFEKKKFFEDFFETVDM